MASDGGPHPHMPPNIPWQQPQSKGAGTEGVLDKDINL